MDIYYIDGEGNTAHFSNYDINGKLTPETLKQKVGRMSLMADVDILSEFRGCVRVHKYAGTTMFFADGANDHAWLKSKCVKKEDKGSAVLYHFVFD